MPLNPDDTLLTDQYRILRQLGRGGFGFVYQARDTLIHRDVAIKELIPALVGDEATLKRFLVEARATQELAHEHIVRTYNVFQESGNYYIVMECMAGGSLEDRLREQGALPMDEAVRIAAEVCGGLEHAHRRGIVHCDLKPANVLFTAGEARSGIAKVADFGIAHVSGEMLTRSWMTPAGFVAGTLPYMSPEQADGVREDPRVDVYALGAVLYRMLTGRTYLDFDQRETPGAQADNVLRIRNAQPDPPSTHNRRIPAWLDKVVLKALSKRPEERYDSAAMLQSALERRDAASPIPPPAQVEPAPARQRPAQRPRTLHRPAWFWPAVGVAGVLLVAIAVALALLFGGGTGQTDTPTPEPTQIAVEEPTATSTVMPTRTPPPPTGTPAPTYTPHPTDTVHPTASPTASATASPTATPSVTRTLRPTPTSSPRPPTATPDPPIVCDPSKANAEVFSEIVYPKDRVTIRTDGAIDLVGTAAGHAFKRYTLTIIWYALPPGSRFYETVGWSGEFYEPVVCGLLHTFDTSALPYYPGSKNEVVIVLRAVRPDSNYFQSSVRFYVER
jgi:serine/threonine protein kinase